MNIVTRVETTSRCGWSNRKGRCGKPRASHRGTGHKYEPVWEQADSAVLLLCHKPSCGMEAVATGAEYAVSLEAMLKSREAGWRIIDGKWHCPNCATKFDKREAKKRGPRQASFMDGVTQ